MLGPSLCESLSVQCPLERYSVLRYYYSRCAMLCFCRCRRKLFVAVVWRAFVNISLVVLLSKMHLVCCFQVVRYAVLTQVTA